MNKRFIALTASISLLSHNMNAQQPNPIESIKAQIAELRNVIETHSMKLATLKAQSNENQQSYVANMETWIGKFSQNLNKFEEGLQQSIAKQIEQVEKFNARIAQQREKLNAHLAEEQQKMIGNRSTWLSKMQEKLSKVNERIILFEQRIQKQQAQKQTTGQPIATQQVMQAAAQPAEIQQATTQVATQATENVAVMVKMPDGTVKQTILQFAPGTTAEQKQQAIAQVQQQAASQVQ